MTRNMRFSTLMLAGWLVAWFVGCFALLCFAFGLGLASLRFALLRLALLCFALHCFALPVWCKRHMRITKLPRKQTTWQVYRMIAVGMKGYQPTSHAQSSPSLQEAWLETIMMSPDVTSFIFRVHPMVGKLMYR